MPIYEYKCDACAHEFEELILGRDKEPESCPECHKPEIHRKISNTSFTLSGKGWYATDYGGRNPGAVPADTADSDAAQTSNSDLGAGASKSSAQGHSCGSGCGCATH